MKLLLTSAGLSNKTIAKTLSRLVGLPNDEIYVAFIPTAANVEDGSKDWLIEDYQNIKKQNYGFVDIVDISALPENIWLPRLKKANVIFVGGGNTYYLVSWLRKSGLVNLLPDLLKTRVYVGISAGSMAVTTNLRMSTSQKSYSEKVFPLKDNKGLGFVNFHVRPHFNSEHFPKLTSKNIQKIAGEIPEPVYAIDDNTAIVVDNDKIDVVSEGKWEKFN
jgi:dipeptidase E